MQNALKYAVTIAAPVVVAFPGSAGTQSNLPVSVVLIPGASGTILLEASNTPDAVATPGDAVWRNLFTGAKSANYADVITYPIVALRMTATTATASVELTN